MKDLFRLIVAIFIIVTSVGVYTNHNELKTIASNIPGEFKNHEYNKIITERIPQLARTTYNLPNIESESVEAKNNDGWVTVRNLDADKINVISGNVQPGLDAISNTATVTPKITTPSTKNTTTQTTPQKTNISSSLTNKQLVLLNSGNRVTDFNKAKALLQGRGLKKTEEKLYTERIDYYCGCAFNSSLKVQKEQCGFKSTSPGYKTRAERIEWEHVMPASRFSHMFPEWKDGHPQCGNKKGRECASKVNPNFQKLEGDLHNLFPVIGEVNAIRSNYAYGVVAKTTKDFGKCDSKFGVDSKKRTVFEPKADIKGDVARISLYMNQYSPVLQKWEIDTFKQWDKEDPVTQEECERDRKIGLIQGNRNPFVQKHCKN